MSHKSKQRGAADNREPGGTEHIVQAVGLGFKRFAHASRPFLVEQGSTSDDQRRSGAGPGAERLRDALDHGRRSDREAKTQASQAMEFAERTKDDHRQIAAKRHGA